MTLPPSPLRVAKLVLSNRPGELKRFERWLAPLCDELELPPKAAFALDLALNEALINVINHGFEPADEEQEIQVRLEIREQTLIAEIIDGGRPFNPLEARPMKTGQSLDQASIGGRGIHLIRSYADELGYRYQDGRNHLRMLVKRQA